MLRQKLEELDEAVQIKIVPVQDYGHIWVKPFLNVDMSALISKRQEEVNHCVNNCINHLSKVENTFVNVIAVFEEKLNTYMMPCVLKNGEAKLQQKTGAAFDLVSCVDQSIQESIKILPHLNKLKAAFGISDKGFS